MGSGGQREPAEVGGETGRGSSACQSHGVDNLFQFTAQSLSPS